MLENFRANVLNVSLSTFSAPYLSPRYKELLGLPQILINANTYHVV